MRWPLVFSPPPMSPEALDCSASGDSECVQCVSCVLQSSTAGGMAYWADGTPRSLYETSLLVDGFRV